MAPLQCAGRSKERRSALGPCGLMGAMQEFSGVSIVVLHCAVQLVVAQATCMCGSSGVCSS